MRSIQEIGVVHSYCVTGVDLLLRLRDEGEITSVFKVTEDLTPQIIRVIS